MKVGEFYFLDELKDNECGNNSFFVKIDKKITSENELLDFYYTKFEFPYFGFNWDALWDCLADLDWIKQRNIIIYHQKLPKLEGRDLKIYLSILYDAIEHWKKYEEHNFEVCFDMSDYDVVQQIIGECDFPH